MAVLIHCEGGNPVTQWYTINYNAGNMRVTTVEWGVNVGTVRCRIWNSGVSVYDRTVTGPASGSENVPGNLRAELDGQGFPDLPNTITYVFGTV